MTKLEKRLLEGIDRRIQAIHGNKPFPYELNNVHWLRDLVIFRAYLTNHKDLVAMVNNMPKKED